MQSETTTAITKFDRTMSQFCDSSYMQAITELKKLKTRYSDGRRQLKPQRTIAGWGQGH